MQGVSRRYIITLTLDSRCELHEAAVAIDDPVGPREVIKMITGPFDTPEEILATLIELIDHAEWHGEQLRLPSRTFEE